MTCSAASAAVANHRLRLRKKTYLGRKGSKFARNNATAAMSYQRSCRQYTTKTGSMNAVAAGRIL
jgi:hypothetical protein